jgi:hypothetical protein
MAEIDQEFGNSFRNIAGIIGPLIMPAAERNERGSASMLSVSYKIKDSMEPLPTSNALF